MWYKQGEILKSQQFDKLRWDSFLQAHWRNSSLCEFSIEEDTLIILQLLAECCPLQLLKWITMRQQHGQLWKKKLFIPLYMHYVFWNSTHWHILLELIRWWVVWVIKSDIIRYSGNECLCAEAKLNVESRFFFLVIA